MAYTVTDIGEWHEIANSGWYYASGYPAQRLSLWIKVNSQDPSTKQTTFEVQTYTEFQYGGIWSFNSAQFELTYATTVNYNTYTVISNDSALVSGSTTVTHDTNGAKTVSIHTKIYMSTPLTWEETVDVVLPQFKKVILNPNSGSFVSSKNSSASTTAQTYWVKGDDSESIYDITATRSGYTCNGWYTTASGGTKILDNVGDLLNISQDWSLYPHWTANTSGAPSNIKITPQYFVRGQNVTCSWDAVDGATGYQIRHAYANPDGTGYGSWSSWSTAVSVSGTSYTETWDSSDYQAGMRIRYCVRAVKSSGNSNWITGSAYGYMCAKAWIKVGSNWKYGLVWIKDGNTWKRARCVFQNEDGTWKRGV